MTLLFKICTRTEWAEAEERGRFEGSAVDRADGFIHLSARDQVRETAARHFREHGDLVLVAVAEEALAGTLKWEPSRGGALFPHVYGVLPLAAVAWVRPLPWQDGVHAFPPETIV